MQVKNNSIAPVTATNKREAVTAVANLCLGAIRAATIIKINGVKNPHPARPTFSSPIKPTSPFHEVPTDNAANNEPGITAIQRKVRLLDTS